MKILIDGRLYGLENAGLGRYLINLVDELSRLDAKNEYVLLLRKKYFENLSLPSNWKKILADFRHYSLAEQIKLPGIIKKQGPDLVHFPHFNVPIFYRGQFVVTIHDTLMHDSVGPMATTLPVPLYLIKRLGYRLVFDNAVKRSRAIFVPSETVKTELHKIYKTSLNKVFVTYEGVVPKSFSKLASNEKTPYFIYAGNAYPHKNIGRLIEAIILLNTNSTHPVHLVITSSRGIFTQRLEELIRDLGAGDFVKLSGFVSDEELFSLYRNSIALVFPSLSEGFGLPGLEAMAAQTLVAASDIPVFKEIYKNNAAYFDPNDANSIERCLRNIMNMKADLREEKIRTAKEFVKRYSWSKMAKETLKIYEESGDSLRQGQ
ncbi:MAG: glycosyltransferase family 1 protein [Candidatus Microgenomates bacterium]|jgi:glycosyltransferase involved in cell wall biosynthesis